jgi:hypothetical protein
MAHRRRTRYRRDALGELAAIQLRLRAGDRAAALAELDLLLKRVALAAYPRADVASLAGDAWLAFLDRSSRGGRFTGAEGRPLGDLPFAPDEARQSMSTDAVLALTAAAREWIKGHRVPV